MRMFTVTLVLVLAVLMLAASVPALASDTRITVPIDYQGAWVTLPDQGFKLFLPEGWIIGPASESDGIALVDPDTLRTMWVEMVPGEGFALEDILAAFQQAEGFTDVSILHFGQIPFISYSVPGQDMFGAVTLSADGNTAFFFKFKPLSDQAYSQLSLKIMSTMSPAI